MNLFKLLIVLPSLFINNDREIVKKEIIEINRAFYNTKNLAVNITTTAYNLTENRLIKVTKLSVIQKDDKFYTINGNTESMANSKHRIDINHGKKIMIITKLTNSPPVKTDKNTLLNNKNIGFSLDTIIDMYKDVSIVSKSKIENEITFLYKEGDAQRIEIFYNNSNYQVNSIELYTKSNSKSIKYNINYSYSSAKRIDESNFKESNYFDFVKGKIVAKEKFKDYKIVYH